MRKTSSHYTNRDREREQGYTPDLIKNPIRVPVAYFESRLYLFIVMSDGRYRTMTDEEENLWAEGRLNLPRMR